MVTISGTCGHQIDTNELTLGTSRVMVRTRDGVQEWTACKKCREDYRRGGLIEGGGLSLLRLLANLFFWVVMKLSEWWHGTKEKFTMRRRSVALNRRVK